jgi:hypothetical protein
MAVKQPQVSATVSNETYDEILKIMDRETRTISSVVNILLIQAIKERNRKKKGTKND